MARFYLSLAGNKISFGGEMQKISKKKIAAMRAVEKALTYGGSLSEKTIEEAFKGSCYVVDGITKHPGSAPQNTWMEGSHNDL